MLQHSQAKFSVLSVVSGKSVNTYHFKENTSSSNKFLFYGRIAKRLTSFRTLIGFTENPD